jgi:hypothetical protein
MTRLEGTRRELYGLGESKAITSELYVSLAAEPIGRWPTGRNRLVLYLREVREEGGKEQEVCPEKMRAIYEWVQYLR